MKRRFVPQGNSPTLPNKRTPRPGPGVFEVQAAFQEQEEAIWVRKNGARVAASGLLSPRSIAGRHGPADQRENYAVPLPRRDGAGAPRTCIICAMTTPAAMLPANVAMGWRLANSRASDTMVGKSLSIT